MVVAALMSFEAEVVVFVFEGTEVLVVLLFVLKVVMGEFVALLELTATTAATELGITEEDVLVVVAVLLLLLLLLVLGTVRLSVPKT